MDSTILATVVGLVGGILGAVIGGVFALKATKRQVEVMLQQSRGDVNERLYGQSLDILRFFAENPELRPYFYDNKDLDKAKDELERLKILSTAEMVGGFMELVALQIEEQPADIQPRWKAYLCDQYRSSALLRSHIDECRAWYADAFLRVLPAKSTENEPAQKIGAAPGA